MIAKKLRTIRFFFAFEVNRFLTIPEMAPTAFWRSIPDDMRLKPGRSTTRYFMVMSFVPSVLAMSRETTVRTIPFGTPRGETRMKPCAEMRSLS